MRGDTHFVGGVLFAAVALTLTENVCISAKEGVFLLASGIGALIPDIDIKGSAISKAGGLMKAISSLVSRTTKHRGFTHTILFIVLFSVLPGVLWVAGVPHGESMTAGAALGMLSHLVLDTLNPTGIMWLYPFTKKKYHVARIKTGSGGETAFLMAETAAVGALMTQMRLL